MESLVLERWGPVNFRSFVFVVFVCCIVCKVGTCILYLVYYTRMTCIIYKVGTRVTHDFPVGTMVTVNVV